MPGDRCRVLALLMSLYAGNILRLGNVKPIRHVFRLNSLESYTSTCEPVISHWLGSVVYVVSPVHVVVDREC
jgi:hypothetical protein